MRERSDTSPRSTSRSLPEKVTGRPAGRERPAAGRRATGRTSRRPRRHHAPQPGGVHEHAAAQVVPDRVGGGGREVAPVRVDLVGDPEQPARGRGGDEGAGGAHLGLGPGHPPGVRRRRGRGGEGQHRGREQQRDHQVRHVGTPAEPARREVGRGASGRRRTTDPRPGQHAQQGRSPDRDRERDEHRGEQREQLAGLVAGGQQVADRGQGHRDDGAAQHQREPGGGRARTEAPSEEASGSRITVSAAAVDAASDGQHHQHEGDPGDGVERHRDAGVQPPAGREVRRSRPRPPRPTGTATATTRNGSESANRSTWPPLWPRSLASATCGRRACAAVETSANSSSSVSSTSGASAATITRDSAVRSARTWSNTEATSRSASRSVCEPAAASIAAPLKSRAACSVAVHRAQVDRSGVEGPVEPGPERLGGHRGRRDQQGGGRGGGAAAALRRHDQVVEPGEAGQVEPGRRGRVGDPVGAHDPVGDGPRPLGLDPAGRAGAAGAGRCRSRSRRTCRRRPGRACGPSSPASGPRPRPWGTGPAPRRACTCPRASRPGRRTAGRRGRTGRPGPAPRRSRPTRSGRRRGRGTARTPPPPGRRPPAPGRPPGRRAGRSVPSCAGTEYVSPRVYGARSSSRVSSRCSADSRAYIGPSTAETTAMTQTTRLVAFIPRRVHSPASSILIRARPARRAAGAPRRPRSPRTAPGCPRGTAARGRRGCARRRPRRPRRSRSRAGPRSRSGRCGW